MTTWIVFIWMTLLGSPAIAAEAAPMIGPQETVQMAPVPQARPPVNYANYPIDPLAGGTRLNTSVVDGFAFGLTTGSAVLGLWSMQLLVNTNVLGLSFVGLLGASVAVLGGTIGTIMPMISSYALKRKGVGAPLLPVLAGLVIGSLAFVAQDWLAVGLVTGGFCVASLGQVVVNSGARERSRAGAAVGLRLTGNGGALVGRF